MGTLIVFLLVALLVVSDNVSAQVQAVWAKRFNGPANSTDNAKFVAVDNDGFVYVGGTLARILNYPDYGVIKYDQNGDTVWVRYHSSPVNKGGELYGMALDNLGNVIVTGASEGINSNDFATVKYDANGNQLWESRHDGGDIDAAMALAVDGSGNVFVTGTSWEVYESYNYLTIKYTPAGDSLWARFWKGPDGSADMSTAMALDKAGNAYVSGTFDWYYGTVNFLTMKYVGPGVRMWAAQYDGPASSHDYVRAMAADTDGNIYVTGDSYKAGISNDIVTIKYNEMGDSLWVRRYNGPANGDDYVKAIAVDSAGNAFLAGSGFVSGTGFDYLTIKYNSSGVLQWAKTYAGYSNYGDEATAIAIDKLGNVYVTGSSSSSSTNRDFATMKYDKDGNLLWAIKYNGTGNAYDIANAICVDSSGYVYVAGSSQGVGTEADFATIKYKQTAVGVADNQQNVPMVFDLYQNYPNPFNPATVIGYTVGGVRGLGLGASTVRLVVYDVLGREVATLVNEKKAPGSYEVRFDAGGYASGAYFYRLTAGSFVQTRLMVLMK